MAIKVVDLLPIRSTADLAENTTSGDGLAAVTPPSSGNDVIILGLFALPNPLNRRVGAVIAPSVSQDFNDL